jgi:hypothetical protein
MNTNNEQSRELTSEVDYQIEIIEAKREIILAKFGILPVGESERPQKVHQL